MPENVRPWGHYDIYETQDDFQVKKHTIYPGKRNSYQRHQRREEIWVIVRGQGCMTIDDAPRPVGPGDVVLIPFHTKHRWANTGEEPLILIEIQRGDYFGEDDIERFEDDFGRQGSTDSIWDTEQRQEASSGKID